MKEGLELFVPFSTIDMDDEKLFENIGIIFSNVMIINLQNALIGKNKRISLPIPVIDESDNSYKFCAEIRDTKTEKTFYVTVNKRGVIAYSIFSRGIICGEWKRVKSNSLMTQEEFDLSFPSIIKFLI